MKQHDTILFDLDKTLVYPPDDPEERLDSAFEAAGVERFFNAADFDRVMPEVDASSALDLRVRCFRRIAKEKGYPTKDAEEVARAYEIPHGSEFEPVESATTVVTQLSERGYKIGLVTNGAEDRQRAKLRTLGLETAFDTTVFGHPELGLKPTLAPFETALEALNTDPTTAVKIGDSHEIDIEPANDLGITTVWFPPDIDDYDESGAPDITITDLSSMLDEPWNGSRQP